MKRIIKLFSLLMMLSIGLTSYAHDFEVDGLGYTIISTSELTCEVSGLTNPDMKDIVIPETVTYMGRELSVIKIGKKAFADTEIETVKLSDTISAIPDECFMSCKNLRSVSPLTSVEYFGTKCFYECKALNNIKFNKELDDIRLYDECFYGCSSLESIVLPDNIYFTNYRGDTYFRYFANSGLKKVEINCNVVYGAFYNCSSLTDVVFGNKCHVLNKNSFKNCVSLTKLDLPSSIEELGESCFEGCTSLETINIQNINKIGAKCFADCTSLKAIEYNAKELKRGTFLNCKNLKMVTIGLNTHKITNVEFIDNNHKIVGESPFEGCAIKILNILPYVKGANILYIDIEDSYSSVFLSRIEELHIGRPICLFDIKWDPSLWGRLKSLTISSPYYCYYESNESSKFMVDRIPWDQLTYLKSECLTPPKLPNKFTTSQYTTMEIEVPFEALDAYKNADVWKEFWNLKGYDGVDDIPADNIDDDKVEVYNLQGMRMNISSRDELCKLQPGLYIINGKKEVVK